MFIVLQNDTVFPVLCTLAVACNQNVYNIYWNSYCKSNAILWAKTQFL